ncbi:nucleotide exchange factor GrpE [Gordonia soli]|uniref:Protein GrpE n=1 Tax=Gordonia soli NBRC 108243 TaxID=1223545 RepID=M0QFW7_9ACTN|nr:nucleotide exchange factor GrpE [Gordonia soli]GAC67458.1 protein GrpE [Gordonia soli NBRC 108243]
MTAGGPEGTRPDESATVADRAHVDPETGEVRGDPAAGPGPDVATDPAHPDAAAAAAEAGDDVEKVRAELTADLQRLQADFTNYRRRAEKEKQSSIAYGKSALITDLLPVLDDLERARAHGDLESGPLKSVADKIADVFTAQGLTAFGQPGEPFDPELHEAVQHEGDGSNPVIDAVYRQGYRFGDRTLRHAMVTVTDAVEGAASASADPAADSSGAE